MLPQVVQNPVGSKFRKIRWLKIESPGTRPWHPRNTALKALEWRPSWDYEQTPSHEPKLLGPRMAPRLTDKAWDIIHSIKCAKIHWLFAPVCMFGQNALARCGTNDRRLFLHLRHSHWASAYRACSEHWPEPGSLKGHRSISKRELGVAGWLKKEKMMTERQGRKKMAMAKKNPGHNSIMQIDGGGPAVLGLGTTRIGHLANA